MLFPNIFICLYGAILISLLSFVDQLTSFSALFSFKKHPRNVRTWERRQLVQILNRLVGESFSKNITFEQIPEEGEGVSHAAIWEQSFLGKENSQCKGSEMGSVCCDQRTGLCIAGAEWAKENAVGDASEKRGQMVKSCVVQYDSLWPHMATRHLKRG